MALDNPTFQRHEETVAVKVTGADDRVYEGSFTWIRRTLGDLGAIAAERSRLMQGQRSVGGAVESFVDVQAELAIVTVKAPAWWDLQVLADTNVLIGVWNAYTDWRDAPFRPRSEGEKSPGSPAASPSSS